MKTTAQATYGGTGAQPKPHATYAGRWLTVQDCLEELNIPRSTWEKWRQRGLAPRAKKLPNGQLRIASTWLEDWLTDLPENP